MLRKLIFILTTVLLSQTLFAQAPEGINYQAVIRNGNGTLVTSTTVAIRIQIKQTSATGTIVYQERHSVMTSSQGLVNLVIGSGVVQSGVFASINWGTGPYFVSLGVDFANGTNYQDFGAQQLMSVPFALYAKTAGNQLNQWRYGNGAPASTLGAFGDFYLDVTNGNVYYKNTGSAWILTGNITGPQGVAGAPGSQGIQGPVGPQGANGATGLTGPAGPQGSTGPQGPQGPIGLTGPQGAVGPQGAAGATGLTGPVGPQGPSGTNGTNGNTILSGTTNPTAGIGLNGDFYINTATNTFFGPKTSGAWSTGLSMVGPQGLTGATGAQGPTGLTGPAGATGPQGPIGLTGPQGAVGSQGPIGLTGATGPQGTAGTNGTNGLSAYQIAVNNGFVGTEAQWLTSLQGPVGATGATGSQGPTGLTGPAGATGPQGSIGLTGPQGALGPQGAAGATGLTGPAGPQGATGPQGPQGPIGLTGPQGAVGPQGPIGLTGATGAQGTAGTNGTNGLSAYQIAVNNGFVGTEAQWLTSLQGSVGATGATGSQGMTGAQGPTGLTGPAGATGPQGPIGLTGPQGAAGSQGPIGLTGATGAQGTAGTNGTNGLSAYQIAVNNGFVGTEAQWLTSLQGPAGASGPQGPIGLTGPQGAAGPQGPIGLTGATGAQGTAGTNGVGIVSTVSNSNGSLTFNYSDGSSFTTAPLSGTNNSGQAFSNGGTLITNRNMNALARVIITDSVENVYVLGDSYGGGLNVTIGNTTITNTGATNDYIPFLFKVNNDGTIAWLVKLSNSGDAMNKKKIAIDNSGIYVPFSNQISKYSLNGTLLWTINANANAVSLIIGNDGLLYALQYTGASNVDTRIARYNRTTGSLVGFNVIASGTGNQIPFDFCIDASSNFYVAMTLNNICVFSKLSATYNQLWSQSNSLAANNFGDLNLDNLGKPFLSVPASMTFSGVNGRYFSFNQSTGTPTAYYTSPSIYENKSEISYSQQSQKMFSVINYYQQLITGVFTYGNDIRSFTDNIWSGSFKQPDLYNQFYIGDMLISPSNNMYITGSSTSPFINGISGQIVIPIPGNTMISIIKAQL
jgi:hypothetical protein